MIPLPCPRTEVTYGAIVAPLDDRLTADERHVLHVVATWPGIRYIDDAVRAGDITLNELARRARTIPKPAVFYAVARLEAFGYLPDGGIR